MSNRLLEFVRLATYKITGSKERERDRLLRQMPKRSICAEIGVYKGDFSARILKIADPAELHLIDPWRYETSLPYKKSLYGGKRGVNQAHMDLIHDSVLRRFEHETGLARVRIHRADSLEAGASFPDEYFDWIYIDGNHQYEHVKADLREYFPKLRPKGYLAGDDYGIDGWWQGGVTRAVDEFLATGSCEPVAVGRAQFCLRKI